MIHPLSSKHMSAWSSRPSADLPVTGWLSFTWTACFIWFVWCCLSTPLAATRSTL